MALVDLDACEPEVAQTPDRTRNSVHGRPHDSDLAIACALTLRTVFHLPLRQTEGFVCGLIRLIGLDLETPDHTTLSRRSARLLLDFDNPGGWMAHCHILEHAALGMMALFEVVE